MLRAERQAELKQALAERFIRDYVVVVSPEVRLLLEPASSD